MADGTVHNRSTPLQVAQNAAAQLEKLEHNAGRLSDQRVAAEVNRITAQTGNNPAVADAMWTPAGAPVRQRIYHAVQKLALEHPKAKLTIGGGASVTHPSLATYAAETRFFDAQARHQPANVLASAAAQVLRSADGQANVELGPMLPFFKNVAAQ